MRYADPPDFVSRSALNGQGRDDSTLFSLHSLTKLGALRPQEEAAPSRDDSGLIDLAALAAMHQERAARPKLDVAPFAPVGLFEVPEKAIEPLPPPPAPTRAPRWRTIALLAGAVTAIAAASAIAMAATHSAGDARLPLVDAPPTATVPAPPPPQPPQAEAPMPTEPTPTEAKPTETTAKPRPGPTQGPSRRGPKSPGPTGVKPEPPKQAPACDLMCQMQKSVAAPR